MKTPFIHWRGSICATVLLSLLCLAPTDPISGAVVAGDDVEPDIALLQRLDSRLKRIELVVSDAADGGECDHAEWVNAGFLN